MLEYKLLYDFYCRVVVHFLANIGVRVVLLLHNFCVSKADSSFTETTLQKSRLLQFCKHRLSIIPATTFQLLLLLSSLFRLSFSRFSFFFDLRRQNEIKMCRLLFSQPLEQYVLNRNILIRIHKMCTTLDNISNEHMKVTANPTKACRFVY